MFEPFPLTEAHPVYNIKEISATLQVTLKANVPDRSHTMANIAGFA